MSEAVEQAARSERTRAFYAWLDDDSQFHEDHHDAFQAGAEWAEARTVERIVERVRHYARTARSEEAYHAFAWAAEQLERGDW